MPFRNEHSIRVKDPGQYKKFRRKNITAGIDAILGIKEGKSEVQALRFDKDKFSPEEAQTWAKKHGYGGNLHPAKAAGSHSGPSPSQVVVPVAKKIDYSESMSMNSDEFLDLLIKHPGLDLDDVKNGMEHELEHTDNKSIALKICMDHLIENPSYYTILESVMDHAEKKSHEINSTALPIKSDQLRSIQFNTCHFNSDQVSSAHDVSNTNNINYSSSSGTEYKMEKNDDEDDLEDDDEFSLGLHKDGTLCCEVFSSGEHTDSEGQTAVWKETDLEDIVEKGNTQLPTKPIPITLGHPTDAAPSFGWVEKLKKVGNKIRAKFNQLNENFVTALKNGAYKGRSISLYNDNKIRHIGFLGSSQPAVSDLQPFSFEDKSPCKTYDFNEEIKMSEFDEKDANFLYKLLKKFGLEVKNYKEKNMAEDTVKKQEEGGMKEAPAKVDDAALKEKEVKDPGTEATAKVMAAESKNEANKVADENSKLIGMVESLMSRVKSLEEALAKNHSEAVATIATAEAKTVELENKNKDLEAKVEKAAEQSLSDFVENLIKDGKLRPADKEMTMMALDAQVELDKAPVYNMSEKKEGEPERKSRLEQYKEKLLAMPKIVQFGEFPSLPAAQTGVSFPAPTAGTVGSYIEEKVAKKMAEQDKLGLTSKRSYWDVLKESMAECAKDHPEAYAEYAKSWIPGIR